MIFAGRTLVQNCSRCCYRRAMSGLPYADRLIGSKKSVWIEFTALAVECDAVNLGQGFPDYPAPNYVAKALQEAASKPPLQQYTRGFGHARLVKAVSQLYSKLLGRDIDPMNEVLATIGAYMALFYSAMAFINHGDEAIVIEPFYDSYEPMVRMAGGTPVFVPLRLQQPDTDRLPTSNDLKLDFDELESKMSKEKTKLLFLNNPNNPSGKVFTREELEKIAQLVEKYDVIVVADEVYEWMTYPSGRHIRFATLPKMWDRTITIGSAGKTFSSTGWKLGWLITPWRLMEGIQYVHQNCIYTGCTPIQEAVAAAFEFEMTRLDSKDCYFNSLSDELLPKRDLLAKLLCDAGMTPIIPEGGYFMLADYSSLKSVQFEEKPGETKDVSFTKWLTREKKLATIPPSAFYCQEHKELAKDMIRLCFFKKDETLQQASAILKNLG